MEKKYEPVTGEALTVQKPGRDPERNFNPRTGRPLKKKNNIWRITGAVAGVLLVAAIGVFAGFKSGLFLNSQTKVLLAVKNTFEPYEIMKALDCTDIMSSEQYTVSVGGTFSGGSIDVTFGNALEQQELSGGIDSGGIYEEFVFLLDKEHLKCRLPFLDPERNFTYYYMEQNDGFLLSYMGEEELESINKGFQFVNSSKKKEELRNELGKNLYQELKKLSFESVPEKSFEVDGEYVSCKGFGTYIAYNGAAEFLDSMQDTYTDYMGSYIFKLAGLHERFQTIQDNLQSMGDTKARFYIYQNKLSGIEMELEDGYILELCFLGGDFRSQNIQVKMNSFEMLRIQSVVENQEESTKIISDGKIVLSETFDMKSGEFEIQMPDEYRDIILAGSVQSGEKEKVIAFDEIQYGDTGMPFQGTITIKEGAEIDPLEGKTVNIGTMSETEWGDLLFESLKRMYGL